MTATETIEKIHSLRKFRKKPTLEYMRRLADKLGLDLTSQRFIHIAGTNGKGSTATILAAIAEAEGLKVGLFTSPYIVCFNERIMVDGEMISDEALSRLAARVFEVGEDINEFECITAIALMYFKEMNCDLVVMECGMGGRDDATNIIPAPLCSVITHIGLDHTEILGDTIEKIALQKIGIAKEGCPVVTAPNQPDEALRVMRGVRPDIIAVQNTSENIVSDTSGNTFELEGEEYSLSLAGEFQVDNALTAITVAKTVGLFSKRSIQQGLREAFIPARAEVVSEVPLIIIDGAHNPDGAKALLKVIEKSPEPRTAVVGMMKDKDREEFLALLLPLFNKVLTVTVKDNPRSCSAEELKVLSEKYCDNVIAAGDYEQAVTMLRQMNSGSAFCFGSLYLASDIRKYLM